MIRRYSKLITMDNFLDRFEYLKLGGVVGKSTFGSNRYLNQILYRSYDWKKFRREIILRDDGCDLADPDREIDGIIIVHHINPITIDDVKNRRHCVFDPENVVCVSHTTHEAIHYGDDTLLMKGPVVRRPGDTIPWR